jgi:hypothetical protein
MDISRQPPAFQSTRPVPQRRGARPFRAWQLSWPSPGLDCSAIGFARRIRSAFASLTGESGGACDDLLIVAGAFGGARSRQSRSLQLRRPRPHSVKRVRLFAIFQLPGLIDEAMATYSPVMWSEFAPVHPVRHLRRGITDWSANRRPSRRRRSGPPRGQGLPGVDRLAPESSPRFLCRVNSRRGIVRDFQG